MVLTEKFWKKSFYAVNFVKSSIISVIHYKNRQSEDKSSNMEALIKKRIFQQKRQNIGGVFTQPTKIFKMCPDFSFLTPRRS